MLHVTVAVPVRPIERLQAETKVFHAEADEDALELLESATPHQYRRFLLRCMGFVMPVERAIVETPRITNLIDTRRFRKYELLRRDLLSLRFSDEQIDTAPQCTVPLFDTAEEALGWAYVIERSTLGHTNLFRHLGMIMPGEVAFASSYLKCYFGAVGEMWRAFGRALDLVTSSRVHRLVESAKMAFRTHRAWRQQLGDRGRPPSDVGDQQTA